MDPSEPDKSDEAPDAEWKDCAQWLHRCQLLADDHPSLQNDATVLQLVHSLMDGGLLCHLIAVLTSNEVDPRTMQDFNASTQFSQFLCCKNIRLFTTMCRDHFEMTEEDIFEATDLYHAKNFGKVISCLSKLSEIAQGKGCEIAKFPQTDKPVETTHGYYNDLEDIANKMDQCHTESDETHDPTKELTQERIYDTVVHKGLRTKPSEIIQTEEPTTAREYCIREIVDSEKNYVEMLHMLLDKYKKPLQNTLSSQELDVIFRYIEDLHSLHRELLGNLNVATQQHMKVISIYKVFINAAEKLLIYGDYCSHLQMAQTLVVDISKHDMEKKTKIELCQSNSTNYNKFHLTELLMVPLQRVLKYHLLLDNLCKLTNAEHPDKPGLIEAYDAMCQLATSVNEVKRDLEHMTAIDQIEASMQEITLPIGTKLTTYGRRQMDGELKHSPDPDVRPKHRHVFVFDKMLLLCKSKKDSYTFKDAFHVFNSKIETFDCPVRKMEKWTFCFTLQVTRANDDSQTHYFYTKSDELRQSWIRAVLLSVENINIPGNRANGHFEMTTFTEPTYCYICRKLLRGMFFQGYRCKETKRTAHKDCLIKAAIVPGNNGAVTSNGNATPQRRSTIAATGVDNSPIHHLPNQRHISLDSSGGPPVPIVSVGRRDSLPAIPGRPILLRVRAQQCYTGQPGPPPSLPGQGPRYPLVFAKDDNIEVVSKEEANWWQGRLSGREGWFPASYVKEYKILEPPLNGIDSVDNGAPRHTMSMIEMSAMGTPGQRGSLGDGVTMGSGDISGSQGNWPQISPNRHSFPTIGDLTPYPWYVGEMDRNQAFFQLQSHVNGTYLVRVSKSVDRIGEYALSVMYHIPKHIRIRRTNGQFYLSENMSFVSIPALVEYYSMNSLHMCFTNLNTTLSLPFKQATPIISPGTQILFNATALHDFLPQSDKQLQLTKGDRISVISLSGCDRGWWKGCSRGKVGLFPLKYVLKDS